jgi:hypothetical protein
MATLTYTLTTPSLLLLLPTTMTNNINCNSYAAAQWSQHPASPADATEGALLILAGAERAAHEVSALLGEAARSGPVSVARGDRDLRRYSKLMIALCCLLLSQSGGIIDISKKYF